MTSNFRPTAAKLREVRIGNNSTPALVKSGHVANLQPADQQRVLQIKKQLNNLDPLSLVKFGENLHEQSDIIVEDLVKHATIGDLGDIGASMTDIMQQTQKVNVGMLRKPKSKLPMVGKLINRIRNVKGKVQAQYTQVSTYIADMTKEVDTTCHKLEQNVNQLTKLFSTTEELYKQISLHMIALQARHEEVVLETDAFERTLTPQSNPFDHQQVADARRYLVDIETAYANFKALSTWAMHTAKGIRATQQSSVTVIQKFGTIKKFVFPGWKTKFAVQLAMEDVVRAADVANTIDDANNQLARDNASMIKTSSIEVTKVSQRGVYDLDTLEFVQQEMVTAAQEVCSVIDEGTKQRLELIARADQMKLELLTSTTKKV